MRHLAQKLTKLHRLNHAATLGKTMPRQMSSIPGKQTWCSNHVIQHLFLPKHRSKSSALLVGKSEEQAGPDIGQSAPHLQQESG